MLLITPEQKLPLKPQGPQLFVDWRLIATGDVSWVDPATVGTDEKPTKMSQWGPAHPEPVALADTPYGIRLQAEPAHVIGPIFPRDKPWEQAYLMYVNNVLFHDGKYKMWYTVVPPDHYDTPDLKWHWDVGWVLCYAESEDGLNWTKPELGLQDYKGQPTNWVYGRELSPNHFASGAVVIDETAPPEERFKLIYRAEEKYEDPEAFLARQKQRFGEDMDPKSVAGKPGKEGTFATTAGAVSADGIHWKPLTEPLVMYCSDQMNTAFWDDRINKYVSYFRMQRAGRRSAGRTETSDFETWSTPYPVLEASLTDHPTTDIMHCPVLKYPGTNDVYLMYATMFNINTNNRDVALAVSSDGLYWHWSPGERIVSPQHGTSEFEYDDLEAGYGLVDLPGDLIGLPVVGYEKPYKYPRFGRPPLGVPGYATWKRHRVSAVIADDRGLFTTHPLVVTQPKLKLNYKTRGSAGSIRIEVLDGKGRALPGFTLADAPLLSGDELDADVTWKGGTLADLAGTTIQLRFHLHIAKVFSFEFTD
ncbi:hypothetical protein [Rhodococcoides kyotonense]|uniref:Uncharacterized protein n=1 Tax=Rhodococcoides kyotonense TaxID=398843 RepID=A0A239N1Z7_9NOCA|nr:hypothetical protein [Rhodococcus kyotonensis]SNT48503.1 hypothetical protein SAMN05421642_1274 [Rhodococcus kyotonensis]